MRLFELFSNPVINLHFPVRLFEFVFSLELKETKNNNKMDFILVEKKNSHWTSVETFTKIKCRNSEWWKFLIGNAIFTKQIFTISHSFIQYQSDNFKWLKSDVEAILADFSPSH